MAKENRKYVYFYGINKKMTEGNSKMKSLLGGKGANLAEMANAGLPVPPGFTISTEACACYSKHGHTYPDGLKEQIQEQLSKLENAMGKKLGDPNDPLLVSVRSGAAISMPGMMDTVLNLGLNDKSVQGLIKQMGNERLGWDSYRRFIDMFGNVVMGPSSGLTHEHFEEAMSKLKKKYKAETDNQLTAEQLKELVGIYKKIYRQKVKSDFPQDPMEQLELSIRAVFNSWDAERAVKYREINKITGLLGTGVNVCTMVFGNMGSHSGTGVAFTRDGGTGASKPMGEYLIDAQGEDVVAGIRTPKDLNQMAEESDPVWAKAYEQLHEIMLKLEKHYKHPQDVEFTVQEGKLFMLQTRNAKRTGLAGIRWAVEMATGKDVFTGAKQPVIITERQALNSISGSDLEQLLFPIFDIEQEKKAVQITTGLPAGPGAAVGKVVFNAKDAEKAVSNNKDASVILVRHETSPDDVGGMWAAKGILTTTGGMTSHAAVVARGWGKCCICGAGAMHIDYAKKTITVGKKTYKEGDWISLNGSVGVVYEGKIPTSASPVVLGVHGDKDARKDPIYKMYATISKWSDKYRKMKVRTNADTPEDSEVARRFGAEGIGLCRTEHMFFEGDRIWAIREFILAEDLSGRKRALSKLLRHQQKDFEGIFKAMDGLPVTIRLLDPPLHEFVPHSHEDQVEMARRLEVPVEMVTKRVEQLKEFNPMLGHRGCRLSITYPELCEMQTKAIIRAACKVSALKKKVKVMPEIMIPLIGTKAELDYLEQIVRSVADEEIAKKEAKVEYMVGTMIEIPRAALTADEIAETAQFFSFGTNDLTQMTFGYSRDDIGTFLPDYISKKILPADPFQTIDVDGVGKLVMEAVEKGRRTNPKLKCGICGEHGGDPDSVKFCSKAKLDYVSCSPFRVPIARLAAAQAAIGK
jgi:pyruvate, orthophosphate dikinase